MLEVAFKNKPVLMLIVFSSTQAMVLRLSQSKLVSLAAQNQLKIHPC